MINEINNKCQPQDLNSCPANEYCKLNEKTQSFECYCKSKKYKRIDNKCYEYLSNAQLCDLNSNECKIPHEVCLSLNEFASHGTCQCEFQYERDQNGACVLSNNLVSVLNQF